MREHHKMAIGNFARFGDTDIFPYPLERYIFYDRPEDALGLLDGVHGGFDDALTRFPVVFEGSLVAAGYNGYRWATQIDPLWHTYLLALVIAIGEDIERARIPRDREVVLSYRFEPDAETGHLFHRDYGWRRFQERSLDLADHHTHVLACDISDFYSRIYHHNLENVLLRATRNKEAVRRIMVVLSEVSNHRSYGLPVGGPAARLLSELLLTNVDRLLLAAGVSFCRFADDYHLFADSIEEAYSHLVLLSEELLQSEGLSLQKAKTRLMTSAEFRATSDLSPDNVPEDEEDAFERGFFSLKIHYDPYSETAEEDYEEAKDAVNRYNINGMLLKELQKSRIQKRRAAQLVRAVKVMEPASKRDRTVLTILENFDKLYPVFPIIMMVIREVIDELGEKTRQRVFESLRQLIHSGSYITRIPVNQAFAIRILAHDRSTETDAVLNQVYRSTASMMLKRDVILAMAKRSSDFWVSRVKDRFSMLTPWERRALVVASYILGDAGRFFRRRIGNDLWPLDRVVRDWAADKRSAGHWDLPL